jgi:hypothetical protein
MVKTEPRYTNATCIAEQNEAEPKDPTLSPHNNEMVERIMKLKNEIKLEIKDFRLEIM